MNRIAYLAPELPALSATFVYNELLGLEEQGISVVPLSVHEPATPAGEPRLQNLAARTIVLYRQGLFGFLAASVRRLLTKPGSFFATMSMMLSDVLRVGVLSRVGLGLVFRFAAACRVAELLEEHRCEHLHAHFAHIPTDIAMYAAALASIPFSFTAHANDLFERGWLIAQKVERSKFAATISEFNRSYMSSRGADPDKIHIIRCGVDSGRFSVRAYRPATAPFTIGSIGRMVEKKGFDVLLRASALLRDKGIDFSLQVLGSGPLEEDLFHLARQLGLSDIVEFHGAIANQEVPSRLRSLDLFVLPCRRDSHGDMDGIPVVLMEAMLSGVPVVSSRLSGIPELITSEEDGLLVEPEEPEKLARAMERLLVDDAARRSMALAAIATITREFDAELNVRRLQKLIIVDPINETVC